MEKFQPNKLPSWISIIFGLLQFGYLGFSQKTSTGVRDYCLEEGFSAECHDNSVIVITSALYGRMTVGRCVSRNYGYIGCKTDLLKHVAKLCSGKRSCGINNFATSFAAYRACPADLKGYMEVSFECVPVVTAPRYACGASGPLLVPEPVGYLASIVTEEQEVGSENCPWVIRALPGQRINISVVDFSLGAVGPAGTHTGAGGSIMPRYCREYAVLHDKSGSRSVVVCNGDPEHKHVYVSDSNTYTVEIQTSDSQDVPSRFLLKYEVIGCPLPEPPHNAYIRGTWETIVIQCNFTNEAWTLTCNDGVWQGDYGNCTSGLATNSEEITSNAGFLPLGITVVIIIGVALLICISTLIVGLIHLKRRRSLEAAAVRREEALLYGTARPGEIKAEPPPGAGPRFATIDRTKTYSPIPAGRGRTGTGGEYTHIWEVRRPAPVLLPSGMEEHHHPGCPAHPHRTLDGRTTRPGTTCIGTLTKRDHNNPNTNPDNHTSDSSGSLRRDPKIRASFTTFKPRHGEEHIYQSPKLDRKQGGQNGKAGQAEPIKHCHHGPCSAADAPFYFELDPDQQGSLLVAHHTSCSLPRNAQVNGNNRQHFHNSSC